MSAFPIIDPCPFCDSRAELISAPDNVYFVLCPVCRASGPRENTLAGAVKAWNRKESGKRMNADPAA